MSKEQQNTIERIYTIPLKKAWLYPKNRRVKKAIKIIREFAEKHMKSTEVTISEELNEKMWSKGIESPPRRIMTKMVKNEDGVVTVSLAETKEKAITEENINQEN